MTPALVLAPYRSACASASPGAVPGAAQVNQELGTLPSLATMLGNSYGRHLSMAAAACMPSAGPASAAGLVACVMKGCPLMTDMAADLLAACCWTKAAMAAAAMTADWRHAAVGEGRWS